MNIHIHAKAAGILNRQLSCRCGCLSSYNICRNIIARLIHCQVNVLNLRQIFIFQILTTDTHRYTISTMECNRYVGTLNGIQHLLRNLYLTGTYHIHVNRCNRRVLCDFCNLILYRTTYFIPVHSLRSGRSACTVRAIIIAIVVIIVIFRLTVILLRFIGCYSNVPRGSSGHSCTYTFRYLIGQFKEAIHIDGTVCISGDTTILQSRCCIQTLEPGSSCLLTIIIDSLTAIKIVIRNTFDICSILCS